MCGGSKERERERERDLFGSEGGGERAAGAGRGGRGDAGLSGALHGLLLVQLRELPQQERLVILDGELGRAAGRRARTRAAGGRLARRAQRPALARDHVVERDVRVGPELTRELHVLHHNRDLLLVVPADRAAHRTAEIVTLAQSTDYSESARQLINHLCS